MSWSCGVVRELVPVQIPVQVAVQVLVRVPVRVPVLEVEAALGRPVGAFFVRSAA